MRSTDDRLSLKNKHQGVFVGVGGLLLLSVGGLALSFLHPTTVENSYAAEATSTTAVTLEPSISAPSVDPDNIAMTLAPEADSSFTSATAAVSVSTNNSTGYTLTMSTEGTDNNLNLGGVAGANDHVGVLLAETTLADFSSTAHTASLNRWGFTTDNNGSGTGQITADHYLAVPNSNNGRVIKVTDSAINVSTTNVTFAAKVDRDLPAGAYQNTVTFSATANSNPDIFMQDFGAEECAALTEWDGSGTEGDTITLWDRRDGNSYKVRRLADGNCWMTQNLRLSAESLSAHGHTTTLNATDTDITGSFTVPPSAEWDTWDGTNPHVIRAQDAPVGKKSSEGGTPISEPTATYRGTYYNWVAAIAENTSSTGTSVTKTTSICPKGWKLPTGAGTIEGTSTTTTNQFQTLYAAYGSNKADMDKELHYYHGNNSATYAGYWYPGLVYLISSGTSVRFWSGTSSTTAGNAWHLYENSSGGISPADDGDRGGGFSVRCLLNAAS